MELNKKREAELQRLRRELEESSLHSDALAASLRKRHSDAMAELSEQCEALQRVRAKLEKEKQNLRMDVDELAASLESVQKAKVREPGRMKFTSTRVCDADQKMSRSVCVVLQASSESQIKKLEEQLSEANRRGDDLQRALTELSVAKNRLTGTVHPKLAQTSCHI